MSTTPYNKELNFLALAVQRATIATKQVLHSSILTGISKEDKSPVSIADFAAQALLVAAIHHQFPDDAIIGEENAATLRQNSSLREQVWDLVQSTHLSDQSSESLLYTPKSVDEMLDLIDFAATPHHFSIHTSTSTPSATALHSTSRSNSPSSTPTHRIWTFDPIDGTKTYLTGGQYTVCASLIIDNDQKVAAFACPHMSIRADSTALLSESHIDRSTPGHLVCAVRGHGATIRPLTTSVLAHPVQITPRAPLAPSSQQLPPTATAAERRPLLLAENTASSSPYFPHRDRVAAVLGAAWPPIHLYSTQLKYVALALGVVDVVLRIPASRDAKGAPHIWDHAGGILIFEECGGVVTDLQGRRIDWGSGERDLTRNLGVVAAVADVHQSVLDALRSVIAEYEDYKDLLDGPDI